MKEIATRANAEVRIYDGEFVVDRPSFVPRRDYHAKVAMMKNTVSETHGLVLGSGNFSYNGLRRSIEAGSATIAVNKSDFNEQIRPVRLVFEGLWNTASPLADIAGRYDDNLVGLINQRDKKRSASSISQRNGFWIEAGYVTKNRGENKPGNQIFAPNGFRKFFGLKKVKSNTTQIGVINFKTDIGQAVTKNYRENDNGMEKLTLPMPEDHGFGVYDGKVLVFETKGKWVWLSALEPESFELIYGHRLANVGRMTGGRRFGEFV